MANSTRQGKNNDHIKAHQAFLLMESLLEKLKVLNFEEVLEKHNMKYLTKHYFVASPYLPSNPREQFYVFTIIAAWLFNVAGRPFKEPQESDDPNATVSRILREFRALGVKVDFPPSKLMSGSGEHVCFVLDRLAEKALRTRKFSYQRPIYPTERADEEHVTEDDAELTDTTEEEEEEEEEEMMVPLQEAEPSSKLLDILETTVSAVEWKKEVEGVRPLLKINVTTDNTEARNCRDWMHQHRDGLQSSVDVAKVLLLKLQENIGETLEKVRSRETYINSQLDQLIQEYQGARTKVNQAEECVQEAKRKVTERTRVLEEVNKEIERVNMEVKKKNKSLASGGDVVVMKQSFTNRKTDIIECHIIDQFLNRAHLEQKSKMMRDMFVAQHETSPSPK